MFATTYGHPDIVRELISGGAQVDLQDKVNSKNN